jgi:microcystin-dependent protein
MADPFVAEIRIFGFNFPPKGWAFCNGQLLPISQNTALFSLLGTFYGGDGKSTFALPDLQGCAPMATGQGQGLSERFLGETSGVPTVTLLQSEIPAHNHTLGASQDRTDELGSPANNLPPGGGADLYADFAPGGNQQMAFTALSIAGGSTPHNNMMPYLGLNFCIAMQGVFPPRG